MENPAKEICTIRIVFPVSSDEDGIKVKAQIKEILSDRPDAQTQFSLMSMPNAVDIRPNSR
ncbi:hypothetical protein ES703_117038 [subsurface metagenome]